MKHQRTLVISLVMLLLLALTACVQVASEETGPGTSIQAEAVPAEAEKMSANLENEAVIDSTYLAENPELMAAGRYTPIDEPVSDSTRFAANPELMAVGRYVAPVVESRETSGLMNRELIEARRYIILWENGPTLIRVNPEALVTGRGAASVVENEVDSAFFADNPELMIADRYRAREKVTASDFLAENRELIEARRYIILWENGPTLIRVNPE